MGDTLLVTFANKADKVYSILPHGVIYDKSSDAAPNVDGKSQPKLRRKQNECAKDLKLDRPGTNPGPFTYQLRELRQLFQLINLILLTYQMQITTCSSQGSGKQWREFRTGSGPQQALRKHQFLFFPSVM